MVKCSNQVHFTENSYMAGTDEERVDAIHNAFTDHETDIILCAKGGYGTSRILNALNHNIINNPQKKFLGYSDITLLNLYLQKYAHKTKTYFSPNAIDIAYLNANINEPTLQYLVNFLHNETDYLSFSKLICYK